MRAAIYLRVSTDDRQHPENQRRQLLDLIATTGHTFTREFCDQLSGAKSNRPQLKSLLEAARSKEFDILYFWSLDRLSREGIQATLGYLDQLTKCGVAFKSLSEPHIDTSSPTGEMLIAIMATMAKLERVRISDRVKAGLARVKASGVRLGQVPANIDRQQVRALRAQGVAVSEIARKFSVSRTTVQRELKKVA